jgi:hypothetical protein
MRNSVRLTSNSITRCGRATRIKRTQAKTIMIRRRKIKKKKSAERRRNLSLDKKGRLRTRTRKSWLHVNRSTKSKTVAKLKNLKK